MAYFVGRDVDIAIATEHPTQGIMVREPDATIPTDLVNRHIAIVADFTHGSTVMDYANSTDYAYLFAGPKAMSGDLGCDENEAFGDLGGIGSGGLIDSQAWNNQPDNLTGLELSLGVMDEDVAFIGQRNIMKAEIKKDNSVTITRKKSDKVWDGIFNDARFGIKESNTVAIPTNSEPLPGLFTGLSAPDFVGCGYRVVLRFNKPVTTATSLTAGQIAEEVSSFDVADSSGMEAGGYIQINNEIIKIGTVGSSILLSTCLRAQRGTTAAAHDSADVVTYWGLEGLGEVIVLRNCYVTDHAVTLSADGSQEETLSLQSYTDTKIYDGITGGEWDEATTSAEL